jgi:hypothetical protein
MSPVRYTPFSIVQNCLKKDRGSAVHSHSGTKRDLILFGLEFVRLAVLEFVQFHASRVNATRNLTNLSTVPNLSCPCERGVLMPVYTCKFCCDFWCDFHHFISYECSENMYPRLNIHNSSTRSHQSEEENRTRSRRIDRIASVYQA